LFHVILSAYWQPLSFELPAVAGTPGRRFRRCIDTALPTPDDIQPWESAPEVEATYIVQPRSIVLLACALEAPGASNG